MERGSWELRDGRRALGMRVRGPDRLGYDNNYERLETCIAIPQVEHTEEPVKITETSLD
jgi:hypothetical protein